MDNILCFCKNPYFLLTIHIHLLLSKLSLFNTIKRCLKFWNILYTWWTRLDTINYKVHRQRFCDLYSGRPTIIYSLDFVVSILQIILILSSYTKKQKHTYTKSRYSVTTYVTITICFYDISNTIKPERLFTYDIVALVGAIPIANQLSLIHCSCVKCFWASRFPAIVGSTTIFLQTLLESDFLNDANSWKRRSMTHPRSGICVTWSINGKMYVLKIFSDAERRKLYEMKKKGEEKWVYIEGKTWSPRITNRLIGLVPKTTMLLFSLSWNLICRLWRSSIM